MPEQDQTSPAVDAYLADLDHPLAPLVRDLRAAILALDPGVSESVKWNAPNFAHHGADRITFQLRRPDRVQLVLHRGAKTASPLDLKATIPDPAGLLAWPAPDRAVLTVTASQAPTLDRTAVHAILAAWLTATAVGEPPG